MSFFCLLWIPLFYLFRRSISPGEAGGGVWALLLGSVTAVFQFFLGSLVTPGGFGLSRWMSGFVDIVSLPVLAPLIVYFLFILFRVFSGTADFANFALLWLIPSAAFRAISWSPLGAPVLLVLAPLLWTALAAGIPFFINCIIGHTRWYVIFPAGLCIVALPFAAATAWWAFFSQRTMLGFLLLALSLIPAVVSVTLDFLRTGK
ncbi:MAG: hypothetical protein LBD48_09290 [Treponema sp.]|jgi:hypothetical protein|nr:hypothetical protein [Treponema sp.]